MDPDSTQVTVLIVTGRESAGGVCAQIQELHHTATLVEGVGLYNGDRCVLIYTVVYVGEVREDDPDGPGSRPQRLYQRPAHRAAGRQLLPAAKKLKNRSGFPAPVLRYGHFSRGARRPAGAPGRCSGTPGRSGGGVAGEVAEGADEVGVIGKPDISPACWTLTPPSAAAGRGGPGCR